MVKNIFKNKDGVQFEDFYDENNKLIKRVFKVPVGNISRKNAEKRIKEFLDLYKTGEIYEYFRKVKRDERKEKLKKLYE